MKDLDRRALGAIGLIFAISAVVLTAMGRVWWCASGDWVPWSFDVWSSHNSQHLFDPYTFSHVLHGVIFFGVLYLLRSRVTLSWRAVIAALIEATWEITENTQMIIDRYRESTVSLDYNGDSVLNSMADIASCLAGFALAASIPWFGSVAFFIIVELVLLWWIRDNLTLNVIMLVYPLDVIKAWQSGG